MGEILCWSCEHHVGYDDGECDGVQYVDWKCEAKEEWETEETECNLYKKVET